VWSGVTTYRAYPPEAGIPVIRFVYPRWTGLWGALRRADADINYISCAGGWLWQVALYGRLFGRKTVLRVASDADCDPQTLLVNMLRDRKLYGPALRRADLVLSQTVRQRDLLLRNFNRTSQIVLPMTERTGRRLPFEARDIDVLWVANFAPLKRAELLLRLAERLPDLQFHMIGGPVSGAGAYFESMARKATAYRNVQFHGAIPYQEIGGYFERARMLVSTSETEGFPNTYLQAWGCGAPVEAFRDPADLIARYDLGRCVTTFEELQAGVTTFAADRAAWEAASLRCREYMDQAFDPTSVIDPYVKALAAL